MQGHYLDMEGADCLSFRLKGDGRKYMASVRVDNWIVGETSHDVWQAFLFARYDPCLGCGPDDSKSSYTDLLVVYTPKCC